MLNSLLICFTRTFLLVALFFLFLSGPVLGGLDLYGKLESELAYDDLLAAGREVAQQDTLVNIVDFNPKLKITAGHTIGFLDLCGEYTTTSREVPGEQVDRFKLTVRKAYVTYQTDCFSVLLGKERFLKGVGFGWNPADLTNPQKSPLYQDESKRGEDEGVGMASVSYFSAAGFCFYEVTAGVIPVQHADQAKMVLYTKFSLGSFEGFLIGGFQENRPNIYGGYFRTAVPYLDLLSAYGEFQSTEFQSNNKYLLGLQINPVINDLPGSLQFQIEGFYNEDGGRDLDDFRLKHPGVTPVVGESLKHYYYFGCVYNDLVSRVSLGVMRNTDEDRSGVGSFLYSRFVAKEALLTIGGYYVISSGPKKEFSVLTNRKLHLYIGLGGLEDRRIDELSGGQRQRVAIARALVTRAPIVLADEPTGNLDGETSAVVMELMSKINKEFGTTFLFSTHDPRVMRYASKVIELRDGRVESVKVS
jgi:hypothetical protein